MGWQLVGEPYRENDTSASTRTKIHRPAYEQLLSDVNAGLVDVVVAYSTSRLTRRPLEYERLIDLVTRRRLHEAVQKTFNGETSNGWLMAQSVKTLSL